MLSQTLITFPPRYNIEATVIGLQSISRILEVFNANEAESFESSPIATRYMIRQLGEGLPESVIEGDFSTEDENVKEGFVKRAYEWIKQKIKEFLDWITGGAVTKHEDSKKARLRAEQMTKDIIAKSHAQATQARAGYRYSVMVPEYVAKEGETVSISTIASKLVKRSDEVFSEIELHFRSAMVAVKKGEDDGSGLKATKVAANKPEPKKVRVYLTENDDNTTARLFDAVTKAHASLDNRLDKIVDDATKYSDAANAEMKTIDAMQQDEVVKKSDRVVSLLKSTKTINEIAFTAGVYLADRVYPRFDVKVETNH